MRRAASVFQKYIRHPLEAIAITLVWAVFSVMPVDMASAVGGWIARTLGPHLPISKRARRNIRRAFPDLDSDGVENIVKGMWDNLGRTVGEFPHVGRMRFSGPDARIEVTGAEHMHALRDDGIPGLIYSAHMANWELGPFNIDAQGVPSVFIYREANNPLVEKIYMLGRRRLRDSMVPKGRDGAKAIMRALRNNEHVAMLVDQKMNDGIAVPFFGEDAMTAPALAQMGSRFNCPIVGTRTIRTEGAHFKIEIYPPITVPDTGDRNADITHFMADVNKLIEDWIRGYPTQWLWLHNRWPK